MSQSLTPDGLSISQKHSGPAVESPKSPPEPEIHILARLVLAGFIFTFVIARILVIFIMAGKLPPGLFFHVKGTHVHHLNYGIFLLSITGAVLIFARPSGTWLRWVAVVYSIGLGLTFDEFGMWLHLGGLYWQRASYDAVVTIVAVLALISYATNIRRWRPAHRITAVGLVLVLAFFGVMLKRSMKWANQELGPKLYQLEEGGPS
jgi:hypothetical protein